ncbi:MAG: zinc-binding dehydrogenase [Actinomycetota bacterium]
MRAVIAKNKSVEVVDIPIPAGHGTRLRVTNAGICGSDLHILEWGINDIVLGHEFGGVDDSGTLWAVRPKSSCGACDTCERDLEHLCRDATKDMNGISAQGGLAEEIMVPNDRLIPVPSTVRASEVGLVEPLAVVVHGLRRGQVEAGMKAVVVGGGSIGLLTAAALRHRGIDVDLYAKHEHQRVAAERIGARAHASDERPLAMNDVVFDAVCTQDSFDASISACRPSGTLVEFGMFWSPVTMSNEVMFKEITIVPSLYYSHDHNHDDFVDAAHVLGDSPDLADTVVTHRFTLEEAVDAFRVAADRKSGSIKVHINP